MKLIASDVDGTLVKDGTFQIDPQYYRIIRELREKGIVFVVASGRQYFSIRTLFAPIAESGDFWAIAEGGALVYHNDQVVYKDVIPEPVVREMVADIKKLRARGCDVMLSTEAGAYCPYEDSEMYRWMYGSYKYEITPSGSYEKLPVQDIVKISIYHPFDCERVAREWFYDKWCNTMQISSAGAWWVDCVLPNATKGAALELIQENLGITPEESMVFGDNINDIPMLQRAKCSYAVGNAREQTKAAAAFVTAPYWENGVLQELEKLLEGIK